jgi:hypothetical protein
MVLPRSDDVLIAVLGATGAGKTTFICKATGKSLPICHGVLSCKSNLILASKLPCNGVSLIGTQEVTSTPFQLDGRKVVLIDTPGFDDSERTDGEILKSIGKFLTESYDSHTLLTGVILLQSINANRATGTELKRTRVFKKICGGDAYEHVVIATTMWGEIANEADGIRRQQERIKLPEFWGQLVSGGAKVCRHDNTIASAKNIIRELLPLAPVPLQMQVELNTHGQQIYATAAGQQLHHDLNDTSNKVFRELQQLRSEVQQQTMANGHLRQELVDMQARFNDIIAQKRILEVEKVSNVSC